MVRLIATGALALASIAALGVPDAHATIGAPPAGTVCTGYCGTDTPDGSVTASPLGTSTYLFVSTNGGMTGAGEISGYGGTDGSSLQTAQFTVTAGSLLKFYFNFVTTDGGGQYADYAFSQLLNADSSVAATLFTARTEPSGNTSPGQSLPANQSTLNPSSSAIVAGAPTWAPLGSGSGSCFGTGCGYTGWIEADYTIGTAGTYSVLFGATNVGDTSYDTGLAIDGVTVGGQSVIGGTTPVPEPASLGLLAAGLIGAGIARRRKAAR